MNLEPKTKKYIQDYTRRCSNKLISVVDRNGDEVISSHEWITQQDAESACMIERECVVKELNEALERERIASKIIEQKRLDFLELEAKADVWQSSLRDAKNEIKLLKNKIEELCKK